MSDIFGGNNVAGDFEYRFNLEFTYLLRHFEKNLVLRLVLFFYRKKVWNLLFDASDVGWRICETQVMNKNNDDYWKATKDN